VRPQATHSGSKTEAALKELSWKVNVIHFRQPRMARVAVDAVESDLFEISNKVFQGTVLGPPLWIAFF